MEEVGKRNRKKRRREGRDRLGRRGKGRGEIDQKRRG